MTQNIYDNETFFNNYAKIPRSLNGLSHFYEWEYMQTILPSVKDINILELGSGYGWFGREFIKRGAKKVYAIDISEKMIKRSKELDKECNMENKIEYSIQDLENLQINESELCTYDLAFSTFTFHYIVNITGLLNKIHSSLKNGGTLLIHVEHPIFTCVKGDNWFIDNPKDNTKKQLWPVSDYGYEGDRITNWLTPDGVVKQHRTIGTWINTLITCGFKIEHVNEWAPTEEQIKNHPDLLIEKERPLILIIKVTKN